MHNLRQANGAPIRSVLNDIKVKTVLNNLITKQVTVPHLRGVQEVIMVSDASSFKVVAYDLLTSEKDEVNMLFTEEERGWSSGLRELTAVKKAVDMWFVTKKVTNKHVYWCNDSTNVVAFLTKGSGLPHVQKMIFDIAKKLQQLKVVISPIHLSRTDERIQVADERSKV